MTCAALAAAALALAPAGEIALPPVWRGEATRGLSGLARVAGDAYYAVRDGGGWLYALEIGVDRATGQPTNAVFTGRVRLAGRDDLECVRWDAARRQVWVGDERDGSLRAFDPATGEEAARVDVPAVFDAFRFNRSFESLALSPDGCALWTCNEEALCRREAVGREARGAARVRPETPDVDDGPRATRARGTRVRLQRFVRASAAAPWRAAGQWLYETDGVGGRDFLGKARCGVSDLLCLDDGTLLALEREMSVKKGALLPSFRCRVYALDFAEAEDVSDVLSLRETTRRPVRKRRLFGANTGFAMYEGIAQGPTLADGARSVLLVSDGGDGAANRILALRAEFPGGFGEAVLSRPVPNPHQSPRAFPR